MSQKIVWTKDKWRLNSTLKTIYLYALSTFLDHPEKRAEFEQWYQNKHGKPYKWSEEQLNTIKAKENKNDGICNQL